MKKICLNRKVLIEFYKEIIKEYHYNNIKEEDLIEILSRSYMNNKNLILNKNQEYYLEFKREMGIKRLRLLEYSLYKKKLLHKSI